MSNKPKEKAAEKPESLIYVGPNLPGGRLRHATTFIGNIPAHLKDLREKHKQIDDLIVPISGFITAQGNVSQPGTPEYEAYQALSNLSGKEL